MRLGAAGPVDAEAGNKRRRQDNAPIEPGLTYPRLPRHSLRTAARRQHETYKIIEGIRTSSSHRAAQLIRAHQWPFTSTPATLTA
jgi:hypothetical protein